jgi:predicted MFS family arabinose efflux permease
LLAVAGLGGLAANWVANRQASHDPRTAGLSMAVVAAFVLLAGALPSIITSVLAMFAMGGGIAYYQSNYAAYRQDVFAPELLGRVSMVTRTIFYLTMTVGFATGGFIADGLGPDRLFIIFGAIALVGVMGVGFIPLEIDPETGQTI